ncbi:hypothetical protein I6M70_03125 [Acinetobacter pittii]|uniref:hypothetical protein n=1 Tax=Acinetobacter pittii TaxID=48296 RepID=UPI001901BA37|nr:hypothetical protein [Acinetobacter pittii]MBJ8478360.1 hypothetical protein [Acinetobacter pittii]
MKNLLTAQEAFNAMVIGKQVLARLNFGTPEEFAPISDYPADIFAKPHVEFCIKFELMELAGIEFTKPLTPHDVEAEQEIYIVMPTRILRTKFDEENSEILCSVMNGFAQADVENAILQLKAIGATFGQVIGDVEIKDGFNDKPKRQRNKRVKAELSEVKHAPFENINDASNVQKSTSDDVEKKPLTEAEQRNESIEDNYQKTLDTLLQRVSESKTPAEVNAVYRYTRAWTDKQMEPLLQATHKRLTELAEVKPIHSEPPSLLVQIQTASDLTTLDALEIDVSGRDPLIQPKLMGAVKKRRFELENAASNEPDYLLED